MSTPPGPGETPIGHHVIDGGPGLVGSQPRLEQPETTQPEPRRLHHANMGPDDGGLDDRDLITGSADVVLHEERLRISTQRVGIERVRISKRIVATTRTIMVPVRIEQLVITHEPLEPQNLTTHLPDDPFGTAGNELVITLHEEVAEVIRRVVAVERVVVGKRSVVGEQTLMVELAAETAEITTPGVL